MGESEDHHRDGKEHRRRERKHKDRKEKEKEKAPRKSTKNSSASSSKTYLPESDSSQVDLPSRYDRIIPEKSSGSSSKDKDAKPKAQSSWWSNNIFTKSLNPSKPDTNAADSGSEKPSALWGSASASKSSTSSTGSSKSHSRKRGKHDKTHGPLTTTHVAIVGLGAGVIYGIHWFIFKKHPQYGQKLYRFLNPLWITISRPFRPRISNVPGDRRYSVFSF